MIRAVVLALALLFAQQAALAHAIWHIDAAQSQGDGQKALCELHDALGTVLGALDAAPLAAWLEESATPQFCVPQAGDPGLAAPTRLERSAQRLPEVKTTVL